MVDKIKHPVQDSEVITTGTHWKKGKIPTFIHILRMKVIDLRYVPPKKYENKNIAEAPACTKKYFSIPSITSVFPLNIGIKPRRDNSNPIQVINQLSLLITKVNPIITSIKNMNQEG